MDLCEIIDKAAKDYAEETTSTEESKKQAEYDFKQGCIYVMKEILEMKIAHESIVIAC